MCFETVHVSFFIFGGSFVSFGNLELLTGYNITGISIMPIQDLCTVNSPEVACNYSYYDV